MNGKEYAATNSPLPLGGFGEMEQARAAARRLGVGCVQRGADGTWRAAAPWAGSQQATEAADRALRLRLAERALRATGPDGDRRRRLQLAEVSLDPATRRRLGLARALTFSWPATRREELR